MPDISFNRGEQLSAAKMNALSASVDAARIKGAIYRSQRGGVAGLDDGRNYIEPLMPFDVERKTATSIIVRCGGVEVVLDGIKRIALLVGDDGASQNPEDVLTISPTISAGNTYNVYLILSYSGGAPVLSADVDTSTPIDTETVSYYTLTTFSVTSVGGNPTIGDINPREVERVTSAASGLYLFKVRYEPDAAMVQIYGHDFHKQYAINGVQMSNLVDTMSTDGWWDFDNTAIANYTIYAIPINNGSDLDYTNPATYSNLEWKFTTNAPTPNLWWYRASVPIAKITVTGGGASVTVEQYQRGAINISWVDGDAEVSTDLGISAAHPSYSIERYAGGQLQAYNFDNPVATSQTEAEESKIYLRYEVNSVPYTRYVDFNDLAQGVTDYINDSALIDLDHGELEGLSDDDHSQYLLKSGDASRNSMAPNAVIADTNSIKMIDVNATGLYDTLEKLAVDWGAARTLYDLNDKASVDWDDRTLKDDTEKASVDWFTRTLYAIDGGTPKASVEWQLRSLLNSSGQVALDWENNTIGPGMEAATVDILEMYS